MSFDEWFDKNGELYRKPTSDERYLFEAGAQSRQAEIDELQKRVKELELINFYSELHFDAAKEQIDELQKRIDEALSYVSESPLRDVSRKAMLNFLDILKGK